MPLLLLLALLLALPHPGELQAQSGARSIARLVVHPTDLTVTAGDTLRLRAEAFDAEGRPVPDVTYEFASDGPYHRASVSEDGLVIAGNTGRFPIVVTATAPGDEPFTKRITVRMATGDAAYVEITPPVERLLVGQEWRLTATIYSRLREIRREPVTWSSSAPEILRVDDAGHLSALRPGHATITAEGGGTSATLPVEVVGSSVAEIELTPSSVEGRPGQVIRFQAVPRDDAGNAVEGLTPEFSVSSDDAVINPDGVFVGYAPGEYTVTAAFGSHSAEAVVRLSEDGGE